MTHADDRNGPRDERADEREPRAGVAEPGDDRGQGAAPDGECTVDARRLDALEREVEELRAQLQRAHADYQNLRRRIATDVEAGVRRSLQPLLEGLLLVVDHLDMALASPATSDDARALAQGVQLTRRQLVSTLEGQDVEPIPEGGRFDPDLHQAVTQVPSPHHGAGDVVETVRRGYTWRGGVLRHAHVVVAAEPPATAEDDGEPKD